MKITVMGLFDVEGDEEQLAKYSYILICLLNQYAERKNEDNAKKEAEAIVRAIKSSMSDLIDQEQDGEKPSEN